ncbi:MAG TPA: SusC/RagA family TonB-linked outer membrane protein, partial [Chitinophagaceae bacterium]|nr:SusC/RagA family TonB-linked outer membrane protein [Chitinophagaceae bacterium]
MGKNKLLGVLAVLAAFVLSSFAVLAQDTQKKNITGIITDQNNAPLVNATVSVKGNKKMSAVTDINGVFKISVPVSATTLVVSYVGMKAQEISIEGKSNVIASLNVSESKLGEVVVIGYGTQKRGDINGAISSVSARDIANIPQPSIDQMLQGKAAGVTITQNTGAPGAAVSVRVRGITSFTGSEPLYVVDGVQIDGNVNNTRQLTSPASPSQQETSPSVLASLNPNDIESIDILKDASATAIYGSRGSNGVVIITTKKGKAGQSKMIYDGYYGNQTQGKFLKMMDLPQYAAYENTLASQFGLNKRVEFADPSKLGPGTNWQEAVFRHASQNSHTLGFSGASNKTDYYLSGGYFQQKGTVIGSDFNRYSFHANINSQVKDWLKVGGSISANQNKANIGLGNSYGIIYNALLQAPDAAVYNADGSYAGPAVVNGTIQGGLNPVQ